MAGSPGPFGSPRMLMEERVAWKHTGIGLRVDSADSRSSSWHASRSSAGHPSGPPTSWSRRGRPTSPGPWASMLRSAGSRSPGIGSDASCRTGPPMAVDGTVARATSNSKARSCAWSENLRAVLKIAPAPTKPQDSPLATLSSYQWGTLGLFSGWPLFSSSPRGPRPAKPLRG